MSEEIQNESPEASPEVKLNLNNPDKDEKKLIRKQLLDGAEIPGWKLVKGNLGMRLVKDKPPKEKTPKEKVPKEKVPKIQNISLEELTKIIGETVDSRIAKTNKRIKKIKKTFDYIVSPPEEEDEKEIHEHYEPEPEPPVLPSSQPVLPSSPPTIPEPIPEPEQKKIISQKRVQRSGLSLRDQMKLRTGK